MREAAVDELKSWGSDVEVVEVKEPGFIIPGFMDSHIHAPQYSFTGTGYDLPLLQWLEKYTFPSETKLSDCALARKVYSDVIDQTLTNGTTTASYYATIDLQATQALVELLYEKGQRALVGKINMDRNSPPTYSESSSQSLEDTKRFLQFTAQEAQKRKEGSPNVAEVLPIITPRFVPSCTPELLQELGNLAAEGNLPVQSHISENRDEVEWVKQLHPELKSYAEVYAHYGLLTNKTIMGHGIYLSDEELQLFARLGAGISHCPISNFALRSGVFHVRRAKEAGVKVGLGTDVSGGYSPSMLEVMRQAVIASTAIYFNDPSSAPLSFKEVFHLATLGNAELFDMTDSLGTLHVGKSFDALIIDPQCPDSPFHTYDFVANSMEDIFQKFIFLGSAINVRSVFVQGRQVLQKQ